MRMLPCLLFSMALTACGSEPHGMVIGMSSTPMASPAAQAAPTAAEPGALQQDSTLAADDIGAVVLGDAITIPAMQELQLAAVVNRAGAFSPKDSFVSTMVCSTEQKKTIRLVAFAAHGPLRPEAADTEVMILGMSERFTGPADPMYGNSSPAALRIGQPYVELFDLTYGDQVVGHSYSNDVHRPDNTTFSVHVYGRLVALAANDPRQPELQSGHSGIGAQRPIARLDEIVPPERNFTAPATSTF